MEKIGDLLARAKSYTEAYSLKYNIVDEMLLKAIFKGHLAYLINSKIV